MPGGYIDSMSALVNNGGEVVVSRLQEVVVPTYHGSLVNRYAKPVEGAGQTGANGELTAE